MYTYLLYFSEFYTFIYKGSYYHIDLKHVKMEAWCLSRTE